MSTIDFETAWLQTYAGSGLAWVQSCSCVLVMYAYMISNKKFNWKVLFAHAVTGFFGTMIENVFIAKKMCCMNENWAILSGLNEINWIIHETTTVVYTQVKLETVIMNQRIKTVLRSLMCLLFVGFLIFRIQIGVLRVQYNTTGNSLIGEAHSNAFIFWGLADLIIFGLLIYNAQIEITKHEKSQSASLFAVLTQSSIPKLFVIVLNTILIVIVGQIRGTPSQGISNLNTLIWSIKGTYPVSFFNSDDFVI
jgi:hypothetical protein